MNRVLLSIDPSLKNLGYAIFLDGRLHKFGTLKRPAKGSLEERIVRIVLDLGKTLIRWLPILYADESVAVIEKPQLWGAFKSVASMHSGALLGLHILVGALFWFCKVRFSTVHLVPVSTWKGQLPKDVTKRRMEKKYSVKFETFDEADAVGLGDYFLEKERKK